MQLNPFPSYPVLQVQLYSPSVLLQLAFSSHLAVPLLHSLMSDEKDLVKCEILYIYIYIDYIILFLMGIEFFCN